MVAVVYRTQTVPELRSANRINGPFDFYLAAFEIKTRIGRGPSWHCFTLLFTELRS